MHIDIPASDKTDDRDISEINKEFPNAIRQIIKTYSINKNISIEEVANIVDISVRTLQRRLAENNLTFNELHNEAKFMHARERLHDRSVSIKEIARTLGYSDTAHFTRAFHHWSGVSPSDYRKELG